MPINSPRHFIEFGHSMRVLIEDAIESLILLLDEIDGDDDLEETWDREFDQAERGIADDGAVADYFGRLEADEQPVHLPGGGGVELG